MTYRKLFHMPKKAPIVWMPQHMNENLRKFQHKLRNIDCIMEVHDARVPISGRNFEFQYAITQKGLKPHILLLNKKDLTDTCDHRTIRRQLNCGLDKHIIFTTTQKPNCAGIERIMPLATKLLTDATQNNRSAMPKDYNIMLIGLPQVGKSTLMKALRRKARTNCGAERFNPSNRILIQEKPNIYLQEKPLVLQPYIRDDETGLKMALVGCLQEPVIDSEIVADYLLFLMNKLRRYEYVKVMGLHKPCDDIARVLSNYAQHMRTQDRSRLFSLRSDSSMDNNGAAKDFIGMFRAGEFGAYNLDQSW